MMKVKSTSEAIFTLNKSLKEFSFLENLILKRPNLFSKYSLGKFENEDNNSFDEIVMVYKPSTINNLKYLYHVRRIGAGLKFYHMGYVKLNFYQHFQIRLLDSFLWFSKIDNLIKLLTMITAITTCLIGYRQIEQQNKIQKIEIINNKR